MAKKDFTNAGALAAEAFFSIGNDSNKTEEINNNHNNNYKNNNETLYVKIPEFDITLKPNTEKTISKTFNFQKKDLDDVINLTDRFLGLRKKVNQSEIIRMGISLVNNLNDEDLLNELDKLKRINLGRKPNKNN